MTHWCVSREPAPRCGPAQENGLMTGCHLRVGCLAAMCRTLFLLLVFSPVFSILCHISRASLNLQFTIRMRYLNDKADMNEMWGQSNLLYLMFKVVLNLPIFFHFTTWNYHCHFRWEIWGSQRLLSQCQTGDVWASFRLGLLASQFHARSIPVFSKLSWLDLF